MTARPTSASAPVRLKEMQEAFGVAARAPCDFARERFDCGGESLSPRLEADLLPRGSLSGRERLAVYNRQYWYRLFSALHEDYPLLAHALTYPVFNRMASDYLTLHPSRSPYLDGLGDALPDFLRDSARWSDPRLEQIARLERAFARAFSAASAPPLRALGEELRLQPHVSVIRADWNLLAARARCRAADDDHEPVFVKRLEHAVVYRDASGGVAFLRVGAPAFRLLSALAKGEGLDDACGRAAEGLGPRALDRLKAALPGWFGTWTRLGWFAAEG